MIAIVGVVIAALTFVGEMVLGYVVYQLQASTDKLNRAEDKRDERITQLSTQLHSTTEKLIDERFRAISHSVREQTSAASHGLQLVTLQAEELEKRLNTIVEALPMRELNAFKEFTEMKEELCERMVSKEQFRDLHQEHKAIRDSLAKMATVEDLRKLLREARNG